MITRPPPRSALSRAASFVVRSVLMVLRIVLVLLLIVCPIPIAPLWRHQLKAEPRNLPGEVKREE